MNTPSNPLLPESLQRLIQAFNESITVKLFTVGFLVLILLIPSSWIQHLMNERQSRAGDVISEISQKWSGPQTVSGPILVIPFTKIEKIEKRNDVAEIIETTEKAFFLPEDLTITGTLDPETLHRGLFDAVVYAADMKIDAVFSRPDFKALGIQEELVHWQQAYLVYPVTHLGGIHSKPSLKAGGQLLEVAPSGNTGVSTKKYSIEAKDPEIALANNAYEFSANGLTAPLKWQSADDFKPAVSVNIDLRGSQRLNIVPAGKTTTVDLQGTWSDPSFDGESIPEVRDVTDKSFSATWNVLHFNRPFPQQWTGERESLTGGEFGLKLLTPVGQYQQSIRTAKYAHLIIILTFVALFLVEVTHRTRIHPFQYILIGVALTIYYTLLLSISEQIGYTLAYWIASASTIVLVSLYSSSFLKTRLVVLLTSLMAVFYTFIFVIILQQDFSLLIGSIGLFIIVAALMYFSRKIKWYKEVSG